MDYKKRIEIEELKKQIKRGISFKNTNSDNTCIIGTNIVYVEDNVKLDLHFLDGWRIAVGDNCDIECGKNCRILAGNKCYIDTLDNCNIKCGSDCEIDTAGDKNKII